MNQQETMGRAELLRRRAAEARSRSRMLHAEVTKVARHVADTEEAVAGTLRRLASQHPHHARELVALSKAAVENAAAEREWVARHVRPTAMNDGNAA